MSQTGVAVTLATVHPGTVSFNFCWAVAHLLRERDDVEFSAALSGAFISRGRNQLVAAFLAGQGSHLWFVDSDIGFSRDTLDKLLAADRPIVAALYYSLANGVPFPVVVAAPDSKAQGLPTKGLMMAGSGVGMGCTLIRREVLEALGVRDLWPFSESVQFDTYLSEDITFCLRARELGFESWVNVDAKVTHTKSIDL